MACRIYDPPKFRIAGDRGLLVEYGDGIAPEINRRVRAMSLALEHAALHGVQEFIPTYRSVILIYDPLLVIPEILKERVLELDRLLSEAETLPPDTIEIPVCYGGEFGPDIAFVAEYNHISVEDVIRLHSAPCYPVYMIGFTPGFPYLGGLSEKLHTPRLATPRTRVPAGSVGIANNQTGIYSISSPGGWQLVGRSPVKLFDPESPNPFLLKAGDYLKFIPVSPDEYRALAGENP